MEPRGDFVDEFALALGQCVKVFFVILFLELLDHLALLHRLDQGLALLVDLAFGAGNLLLLDIDVAVQALQVGLEKQHVGPAEALPLFSALVLHALPPGVLFFSQSGLRCGQHAASLGKLLLEAFLGVAASDEQGFEAELKHDRAVNRKGCWLRLFLNPGL
jgi:hypothetical protein